MDRRDKVTEPARSWRVSVRSARPEEYELVGELTVEAYRTLPVDHLWGGYDREIRDVASRVRGAHVLVAELAELAELADKAGPDGYEGWREGRVVGCVTYVDDPASEWYEWADGHEAQIRLLAVDPGARGKGVAEALVGECLRRAGDAGRPVVLHTTEHMEAAQRLYERLGFRRVSTRDVHDYEEMTFLAYVRDPPAAS